MVSLFGDPSRFLPVFLLVAGALVLLITVASIGMRRTLQADVDRPGMWGVIGRMRSGKTLLQAHMARRALTGSYRLKCDVCLSLGGDAEYGCEGGSFVMASIDSEDRRVAICDNVRIGPRPVYANFWVEGAHEIENWSEVLEVPFGSRKDKTVGALVLIDEMPMWWPSAAWKVPQEIRGWCAQVGKRMITFVWSAQHHQHVGKRLLELSFGLWRARPISTMHEYTLYEVEDFGRKGAQRAGRYRLKRTPALMAAYDTEQIVSGACPWEDGVGEPRRPSPAGAGTPDADPSGPALRIVGRSVVRAPGTDERDLA